MSWISFIYRRLTNTLILASEERGSRQVSPTLPEFVSAESELWEHALRNNREYFTSSEFMHHCLRVETRILTCCAGLVEIQARRSQFLDRVDGEVYNPQNGILELGT